MKNRSKIRLPQFTFYRPHLERPADHAKDFADAVYTAKAEDIRHPNI